MNLIKLFVLWLAGLFCLSTAVSALAVGYTTDNFDDNVKDSLRWGSDQLLESSSSAFLTETNMHLQFTGASSEAAPVGIIRPWIAGMGSYVQNWEAAVDIHIGDLSLPQYADLQMFLAVAEDGDPTLGDHLAIGLGAEASPDGTGHGYEMTAAVGGTDLENAPNYGFTVTGDQQGRMRIAFDASTKTLAASYNGIPLGSLDVDDLPTSWGMDSGSAFVVVLGGSMWGNVTNSSSEVYADNFELRSGNNLAYLLTVSGGAGSGSYTNNAVVVISASNAPAGYIFDHWVGSTGYVANVAASTTTVIMPAQAITLTPAYQLVGEPSGDDFNDNSKDPLLWGEDIYFISSNTTLQEVSGRLELRKVGGIDGHGVLRPWVESVGSYTQNWQIAADLHLGDVAMQQGAWVNINLGVANRADTNLIFGVPMGDGFDIALDLYDDGDGLWRGYEMTSRVNGTDLTDVPNYGYIATGDSGGRVKISFNADTKVLTASYNGNIIGWLDVDDPATDWEMTDSDTFGFGLAGSTGSESIDVGAGSVYADNFEVIGGVPPPAEQTFEILAAWDFYGLAMSPNPVAATATVYTVNSAPVLRRVGLNNAGATNCFIAGRFPTNSTLTEALLTEKYFSFGVSNRTPIEVTGMAMSLRRFVTDYAPTGFTLRVSADADFTTYEERSFSTTNLVSSWAFDGFAATGKVIYARLYGYGQNVATNSHGTGFAGTTVAGADPVNSGLDGTLYDLIIYGRQDDPDADHNGLPDGWEETWFGTTGVDPSAICSNGVNTILEAYVAGLDPNDPNAFFGITDGDVFAKTLEWTAVSGRVYTVYWSTNLLNGFIPILTDYTGGFVTDTLHSAESHGFYKLEVRLAE